MKLTPKWGIELSLSLMVKFPFFIFMNQIRLSFEDYKKSTFGGKQDKILSVFQTRVKIYFSEKYILGLGAL